MGKRSQPALPVRLPARVRRVRAPQLEHLTAVLLIARMLYTPAIIMGSMRWLLGGFS